MRIGTSSDDVRRRNLSAVLTLVHRTRTTTRAELTRRTGLSRSTVKDLVAELVDAGLVEETRPAGGPASGVGRPSPVVRPSRRVLAVAVNPEVDAITVALVALGGEVVTVRRVPTPTVPTAADMVRIATATIDRLRVGLPAGSAITSIGLAVPGLVHAPGSTVQLAPHLGWHDERVGELLSTATELPVFAANDANVGAVAEHLFGGHPQADHMVYVNGGASGIGAGFVVAGELLGGADGYAGELGHTYVGGTKACHCGAIGCLETEVTQALSSVSLDDQARRLGIALGGAINVMNPRLIVLGGFLRVFPERAADTLHAAVARHSMAGPRASVRIVAAGLDSETLMIGAAELAFGPLLADPAGQREAAIG
ncbi:ROK family protein [Mycolicibacterium litorale]|uniref:ROK family protein n=1 Tax=Mycolicibacterium litorale TaxID=758802 RepID=UPI003CF75985